MINDYKLFFEKVYDQVDMQKAFFLKCEKFNKYRTSYWNYHQHYELLYVTEGVLTLYLDEENECFLIEAGTLVIIPPMQKHKTLPTNEDPITFWILGVDSNIFSKHGYEINDDCFQQTITDPVICEIMDKIVEEHLSVKPKYDIYIQSLIIQLFITLNRNFSSHNSNSNKKSSIVNNALAYIHSNYAQPLTLETIGQQLGVSKSYLSRKFKSETECSIIDYINEFRCAKAKALIHSTNFSIEDISVMCGFSSQSYFSKTFRKINGYSPSTEKS